jgi:hypothetical protein
LQAESGTLLVRGCEFQQDKPQIDLGEKVRRAVIADNIITGHLQVRNRSKLKLNLSANATD